MNKRFSLASASVFVFALSSQINAQIVEPVQPETAIPVAESPVPEPAPIPVQPAVQAQPQQIQLAQQAQLAPAQTPADEEEISKRHELKLDIFYAMLEALRIGYEYTLSYRNALALNLHYSFSKKYPEIKTQAMASYKLYILKIKRGPNFFAETSAGYTEGYHEYWDNWNYYDEKKKYKAFTVGLSGGLKFHIPSADVGLEMIVGIDRPWGVNKQDSYLDQDEEYYWLPMFNLNLIKRF
jgi:hypothetical protein